MVICAWINFMQVENLPNFNIMFYKIIFLQIKKKFTDRNVIRINEMHIVYFLKLYIYYFLNVFKALSLYHKSLDNDSSIIKKKKSLITALYTSNPKATRGTFHCENGNIAFLY